MPGTQVLVVEDEYIVAVDIQHRLRNLGYQVAAWTPSGEEALVKAAQVRPDLVLMDIRLKGKLDGIEAAEQLQTQHDIPVVYLTAYADQATLQRARITAPYGYLLKPFDERELHIAIEMAMYRHDMERKLRERERLHAALSRVQSRFISEGDTPSRFREMLRVLLELTDSSHGFVGEVLRTADGEPYFKAYAALGTEPTSGFPSAEKVLKEFELHDLDLLAGQAIRTGQVTISNNVATNGHGVTLPPGHFPPTTFLGLPFLHGQEVVGMAGIANRPGGYDLALVNWLDPLLSTCTSMIVADRNERLRQQAEAEIHRRNHELTLLNQAQQRLTTAIEQVDESIIITDTQGRILYVNPAFARNSGYSQAEAIDQHPHLLKRGQQDQAVYQEMRATIQSGQTWRGRLINRKKDGACYTEDTIITPVCDANGNIVSYVGVQRDITDQLALEEQYRQAQKMEAIGLLAGGIAHDFNNILTAINGYANLMQQRLAPDHPLQEMAQIILRSGSRAADLVRQLLAFSRRQMVEPRILSVNEVVQDMERMLTRIIGEHIQMKTDLAEDLWAIKADPGQVEQIILNLAVNARDAMPQGGRLTIETANVVLDEAYVANYLDVQPGDYILLAISDTGVGMNKKIQERIFEPFFTTKELGQGTGLGLATVYGIVKQHDGLIWLYSEEGYGTTFKVYLPRIVEAPEMVVKPEEAHQPAAGLESILLVEDEPAVRELAVYILKEQGYTVLEAGDGQEAEALVQANRPDIQLLVTDLVMPGINGKVLAQRLSQHYPGLKVLFMSGYPDRMAAGQGILEAGQMSIQKPFSPRALAHKVREILDTKIT